MLPTQLEVESLFMIPVAGYQTPVQRPYDIKASRPILDKVSERIERSGHNITPMTFAGLATDIMSMSMDQVSNIAIPNGFVEQRYSFLLTVKTANRAAPAYKKYIIQGFTDHKEKSMGGLYDPSMMFYINTIEEITVTTFTDQTGRVRTSERVTDSYQVIQGQMVRYNGGMNKVVMLRPCDVLDRSAANAIYDNSDIDLGEVLLPSSEVNFNKGNTSRIKNNSSSQYLASTIKAWKTAENLQDVGFADLNYFTSGGVHSVASNQLSEPYLNENPFINALESVLGVRSPVMFNYGTLCKLFPNIDNDTYELKYGNAMKITANPNESQVLGGIDYATMMANIVAQYVPTLAINHGFKAVDFIMTNRTLDGSISALPGPPTSAVTVENEPQRLQAFLKRFEAEVFYELLSKIEGGELDVRVVYRLGMDIQVTIKIGGEPEELFVVPAFCDSLIAPTIAFNPVQLDNLAQGFDYILDAVSDNTGAVPKEPAQSEIRDPLLNW